MRAGAHRGRCPFVATDIPASSDPEHSIRAAARSAGASTLLLEVRPSNEGALSLYRHFGFRQIGVRRGYYPAQGGREDALVLTHALEKAEA